MTPGAIAIAIVIGGIMGLLGGGGSIVAVPAFAFVLGLPPKQAVVTSLAVVGFAAAVGAVRAVAGGLVPRTLALVVGGSAIAGSFAGSLAGARLDDQVQLRILAVVMLAAAIVIWRQPVTAVPQVAPPWWVVAAIGLSTGVLTGIAGVGGGFLIVPALVVAAGLSMQEAASASMVVIALAAFSALAGYFSSATFEWSFIVPLAAVAAAATLAGAKVASRLPQRMLQRAFAVGLVVISSWVWVRA